jgi:hypothetical protein
VENKQNQLTEQRGINKCANCIKSLGTTQNGISDKNVALKFIWRVLNIERNVVSYVVDTFDSCEQYWFVHVWVWTLF